MKRSASSGGTAAVFPGQGGPGGAIGAPWQRDPAWSLVERAEDVLGRPVAHLLLDGAERAPRGTAGSQLAIFLTSMMAWSAFRRTSPPPVAVAGHSLGQLSALAAAGVLGFDDAVRLVDRRGRASERACARRAGGMVAVLGLDAGDGEDACAAAPDECWLANDNAPGQVVYAGTHDGLDRVLPRARRLGGRASSRCPSRAPSTPR